MKKLIHFKPKRDVFAGDGFTLVEMLMVIAIIGVLSIAVIGNYIAMRGTRNMHAEGRELLSEVQSARFEAVRRNTCVGVALIPGAAPPADLTNVADRGSYVVFLDNGAGALGCNGICDNVPDCGAAPGPGVTETVLRRIYVREGVALTQSPFPTTNADNNYTDANIHDVFDSVSFNIRSMVSVLPNPYAGPNTIILRNDPNPANATFWGRVIITPTGRMEYQTTNDPLVELSWRR